MGISSALASDLATLTAGWGEPGSNIETALRRLGTGMTAAVESYLGVTITSRAGGHRVVLTATRRNTIPHPAVLSSMQIPLCVLGAGANGDALIFYAEVPGAFVDLAADLSWALKVSLASIVLDDDTNIDLNAPTHTGIAELSAINQAIGALTEEGYTAEDAAIELGDRARTAGQDVHTISVDLIGALIRRVTPEPI